jgi:hypothetical protein
MRLSIYICISFNITGPKSRVNKVVLVTAFGTMVCKNLIIHLHDQQTRFRMLGVSSNNKTNARLLARVLT